MAAFEINLLHLIIFIFGFMGVVAPSRVGLDVASFNTDSFCTKTRNEGDIFEHEHGVRNLE